MSLLNDALKRAQKAQQPRQASSSDQPRLQPAKEKPAPQRFGVWWVVGIVLIVAACSTAAFWWRVAKPASRGGEGYAQPAAPAAPSPRLASAPTQPTPPPSPTVKEKEGNILAKPQPAPSPPPPTPGPAATPTFRLEAIHFRLKNPSAAINGKVVFLGQEVEGARVRAIARESVELEFQGRRIQLKQAGPSATRSAR